MKTLKIFFTISCCIIISNFGLGQSTFNIGDGGRVTIISNTSIQSHNLSISSSGQLKNRGNLTVNGVLVNNAGTPGLILKADAEGYGSLLHHTGSVPATSEQYLSSERWHLVAPGVSNESIEPYLDIYLKKWHESNGTWEYLTQPLSIGLNLTSGYSAWASNDLTGTTTVYLEGNLSAGDVSASGLIYTTNSPQTGWNLVGNPYPSTIDWDGSWTTSNIGGWALIYDNGTYKGWNPFLTGDDRSYNGKTDGLIAPKQGFWIRATGENPELIFEDDSRTHGNVTFYKNEKAVASYSGIHLITEANGYTDETAIFFMEDGTLGFDGLYELEKLFNVDEAPSVYSIPENEKPTAINVLPVNWVEECTSPVIPIGFKINQCENCLLRIEGIETLEPELPVFLEDVKENEYVNLRLVNNYSFSASSSDYSDRFLLHFGDPGKIEEKFAEQIKIYSYQDKVYIIVPDQFNGKASISNISGKKIEEFNLEGGITHRQLPGTGYYVVHVGGSSTAVKKVFIKN